MPLAVVTEANTAAFFGAPGMETIQNYSCMRTSVVSTSHEIVSEKPVDAMTVMTCVVMGLLLKSWSCVPMQAVLTSPGPQFVKNESFETVHRVISQLHKELINEIERH